MRILGALSLVFLLGCGAAVSRPSTVAPAQTEFISRDGRLTMSAPTGWEEPLQVTESEPNLPYSAISLVNQQRQNITVLHPHGSVEYAERVFLSNYMRAALMAAVATAQPEMLEQLEIQSMTVTDPVQLEGTEGAYIYMITTVELDGTVEENRILMMLLRPPDMSTTILVSTTVPAGEGETFPAEVLEIVRTLRYTPQE